MPATATKPAVIKLVKPDSKALGENFAKRFDRFWKLYYPVAKDYARMKPVAPANLKKVYSDAIAARPVFQKTLNRSRKHMDKSQIQAFTQALFHFDYMTLSIYDSLDTSRYNPKPARSGDKGPVVKGYQKLLKEWHWYDGKIDGKFGDITEEAVRKFQKMQKLKVDGKIGKNTAAAIVELGLKLGYKTQLQAIC